MPAGTCAEAHYNIGNAFTLVCNFDSAITAYKKVLKIKPDYAEAWNNLGVVLQDKGDLTASIESYQEAIKIKDKL